MRWSLRLGEHWVEKSVGNDSRGPCGVLRILTMEVRSVKVYESCVGRVGVCVVGLESRCCCMR